MTIGFREGRSSDGWSCDSRRKDCLLPEVSSQRTPSPGWKQLSAHLVEVGQRKHSVRARQVLGQASIPYLGEAPQLLDHSESMLAAGARPRARPIDHPPALAPRPMGGRTPIDPVTHSPRLEKLSPQKFASDGFSAPHFEQLALSAAPQRMQNFLPAVFSKSQFEQ